MTGALDPLQTISLPAPQQTGTVSLAAALGRRRSVRHFHGTPLTQAELSQLLWAAYGLTGPEGLRTAPSAGALYPLEFYVATAEGFYHYLPQGHRLRRLGGKDLRPAMTAAALRQAVIQEAPAVFVIAAVYARTMREYGVDDGRRYVHLDAGHAAQNLLLQAVALDLGAVPLGAFDEDRMQAALALPEEHRPLYLMPVGHPR